MSDKVVLFQVRVMFKFKDKDIVNFKIVTDTKEGITDFIGKLKKVPGIDKISVEYLCEYDCSLLCSIVNINCEGE